MWVKPYFIISLYFNNILLCFSCLNISNHLINYFIFILSIKEDSEEALVICVMETRNRFVKLSNLIVQWLENNHYLVPRRLLLLKFHPVPRIRLMTKEKTWGIMKRKDKVLWSQKSFGIKFQIHYLKMSWERTKTFSEL